MEERMTHYCLGNGDLGCDGCQREKDWQTLNQLPDPLRLAIQGQARRIDDTACILTGRPTPEITGWLASPVDGRVRLQTEGAMVDFSKHKHGDVVVVHCCDECARKAGVNPKRPADSGKASWLCDVCGHHGIGSLTDCEIGDWLRLRPLQPNGEVKAAGR